MILQALKMYYDRKASDPNSDIAPPGWERKELPFLIVLDENGIPVSIEDTREMAGKAKRAKCFLLPQSVKRAMGIAANLLWDNAEYAVGPSVKADLSAYGSNMRHFFRSFSRMGSTAAVQYWHF